MHHGGVGIYMDRYANAISEWLQEARFVQARHFYEVCLPAFGLRPERAEAYVRGLVALGHIEMKPGAYLAIRNLTNTRRKDEVFPWEK